jgi:hypothetical protein
MERSCLKKGDEPDHLQTGRAERDLQEWINDARAALPCRGSGLVHWRETDSNSSAVMHI